MGSAHAGLVDASRGISRIRLAVRCGGSTLPERIPSGGAPAPEPGLDPHPVGTHRCPSGELDSLPRHQRHGSTLASATWETALTGYVLPENPIALN